MQYSLKYNLWLLLFKQKFVNYTHTGSKESTFWAWSQEGYMRHGNSIWTNLPFIVTINLHDITNNIDVPIYPSLTLLVGRRNPFAFCSPLQSKSSRHILRYIVASFVWVTLILLSSATLIAVGRGFLGNAVENSNRTNSFSFGKFKLKSLNSEQHFLTMK